MKIYTRTGDNGDTHLLFGEKISKDNIRCEVYGLLDTVNSYLGMARAVINDKYITSIILDIQNDIFVISTEISVSNKNHHKLNQSKWDLKLINKDSIIKIESFIDSFDKKIKLKPKFVIPGSNFISSSIDISRTQLRSAERILTNLNKKEKLINQNIPKYINRLSDLLFYLARSQEDEQERVYFESEKKGK